MAEQVNYFEAPVDVVEDRECPSCGQAIALKAKVCPHCQVDLEALDKKIRPKIPGGVRALAILYLIVASFMAIGILSLFRLRTPNSALIWLPIFTMVPNFVFLIVLAVAYFQGRWWSWWYTTASCCVIAVSSVITIPMTFINGPSVEIPDAARASITAMQFVTVAVALIIFLSFRSEKFRAYFRVNDAGWLKTIIAMAVVFGFQYIVFTLPLTVLTYFIGIDQLIPGGDIGISN